MSDRDELNLLRKKKRLKDLEARVMPAIPKPEVIPDVPSPAARAGRGMLDVWQGGRQMLPEGYGGYRGTEAKEVAESNRLYEKNYGYHYSSPDDEGKITPDLDGWRIGGQAVATAPLMAIPGGQATTMGRIGTGALAGGLAGGVLYEENPNAKMFNAATGALAGGTIAGALPKIIQGGGKLYGMGKEAVRRTSNAINSFNPKITGTITADLTKAAQTHGISLSEIGSAARNKLTQEANKSIKNTGAFDADALLRKFKAEKFGFIDDSAPTTGQVTRDGKLWSKEWNLSRADDEAGGLLAERFGNQRSRVASVFKGWQKEIFGEGAEELTPYTALNNVRKSVTDKATLLQSEVTEAYNKVPGGVSLNKESLVNRTQQILSDFTDNIPTGVKSRISQIVSNKDKAFVYDDFVQLDQLITRSAGDSNADKLAARELKKALAGVLDDSGKNLTGEARLAYQQAKTLAAKRFGAIGEDNDLVGMLNNGKIDDQQFLSKIKTGSSVDEIKSLFEFVDDEAKKQVRTLVLNDLIESSTKGTQFEQGTFNKGLNKLAKEKLDVIFGDKHKVLKEFGEVAKDLFGDPKTGATNYSGSAIEAGNMVKRLYKGLIDFSPEAKMLTGILSKSMPNKAGQSQAIVDLSLSSGMPKMPPLLSAKNPVSQQAMSRLGEISPFGGILSANQK